MVCVIREEFGGFRVLWVEYAVMGSYIESVFIGGLGFL